MMNKKEISGMPEINQRLRMLVDELSDGNVSRFQKMVSLPSHQIINRVFSIDSRNGRYPEVSATILTKIAANIENLNCRWLLTGVGDPFDKEKSGFICYRFFE